MLIGIQDEILRLHQLGFLDSLLKDQTTGKHIRWATDAYCDLGKAYSHNGEILPELITGKHSGVIRNRARKELELQSGRTKSHAEVFTPRWIVRKMLDEIWGEVRKAITTRFLEITCGEAPFLVQRYDVLTGEIIPIEERDGILDRKIKYNSTLKACHTNLTDNQVISTEVDILNQPSPEGTIKVQPGVSPKVATQCKDIPQEIGTLKGCKTKSDQDILKIIIRAFQSVYGYELQGDNLLIARLNLYMTFEEYLQYFCHRKPTPKESQQIIEIITWNVWQMDGLTGLTPCDGEPESAQRSIFDLVGLNTKPKYTAKPCQIRFYAGRKYQYFTIEQLSKQGDNIMKFDYIVGNPPYQEETVQHASETNGQASRKNIFHLFQQSVDKITNITSVLIYPAIRWIHRSGKGMKQFGYEQINDNRLKKIVYYKSAREVFDKSDIADGISIVIKSNNHLMEDCFEFVTVDNSIELSCRKKRPGDKLLVIEGMDEEIFNRINSLTKQYNLKFIDERIQSRSLFGIESDFVFYNKDKVTLLVENMQIDYSKQIKLLTNDKPGKGGRAKWYVVDKDIIKNDQLISKWKVVVSSANAGGQKRDNQLTIIDNHSAFGRSRVALGIFNTKNEAENFYNYIKTYLIRFMFLMTDENLTSLGKKVPDILDYTNNNKYVDFTKDLDEQLFRLFELSKNEIDYVKTTIDKIKEKRGEIETHVKAMT